MFSQLDAILSADSVHRYWLHRHRPDMFLDGVLGRALFVMLNPSTADAVADDMTVKKCLGFARGLGLDRIGIVNLFTVRATDPSALRLIAERNGDEADAYIRAALDWLREGGKRGSLIFAYGSSPWAGTKLNDKSMAGALIRAQAERIKFVRDEALRRELQPMALGLTADGWPRHPSRFGYGEANAHFQPVPDAHYRALGL